ncbi:MAG: ornithine cyclodeaminase family protein [Planctomycetota bacterium]|nr:ornithine cyclodeaminase family protein [Planctomycetota bacterium]
MSDKTIRFLSGRDIKAALPMKEAVEAMKDAFRQLSAGRAVMPLRTHIEVSDRPKGDALFMPSYSPADRKLGLKIVTLFPENPSRGLPFIQAVVIVLDGETGRALAVMDGATLTAIRTGAASGAATDLLARLDSTTVAIIGAGAQGRAQLAAVCAVRRIRQARVYDASGAKAEAFAQEMQQQLSIDVQVARSSADALSGADVVCTATTSPTPVFADGELAAGVHINAIGSYKPKVREIPGDTVARALVVVDHVPSALAEAGDLLIPMEQGLITWDHIHGELGELVAGRKSGRTSPQQVTFFKSVGVAVQDLAAATRALANAERMNLGTELDLS